MRLESAAPPARPDHTRLVHTDVWKPMRCFSPASGRRLDVRVKGRPSPGGDIREVPEHLNTMTTVGPCLWAPATRGVTIGRCCVQEGIAGSLVSCVHGKDRGTHDPVKSEADGAAGHTCYTRHDTRTRASDPPDIAQTPETTDCTPLAEGSNLAQAVLCCAFAAADIAVAIAAVRPSELRLSAGNAMLTIGKASHC